MDLLEVPENPKSHTLDTESDVFSFGLELGEPLPLA